MTAKTQVPTRKRERHFTPVTGESRTHQSFKNECDLNHMMATYQRTGLIPQNKLPARYEDLSNATDYQTAKNLMIEADAAFQTIPASLRKKYDNNAAKFLAALESGEAQDDLREAGLLVPSGDPATPDSQQAQPPQAEPPSQSPEGTGHGATKTTSDS